MPKLNKIISVINISSLLTLGYFLFFAPAKGIKTEKVIVYDKATTADTLPDWVEMEASQVRFLSRKAGQPIFFRFKRGDSVLYRSLEK